jgi:hypothetical protein
MLKTHEIPNLDIDEDRIYFNKDNSLIKANDGYNFSNIVVGKYEYVALKFIINKSINIKNKLISFTPEECFNFLGVKIDANISKKTDRFIVALDNLRKIIFAYRFKDKTKERIISDSCISRYEITKDIKTGKVENIVLELGEWINYFKITKNNFLKGSVDYSGYITQRTARDENITLPQRITNLYRINKNKNQDRKYSTEKYCSAIWETRARLRKEIMLKEIQKLNNSLKEIGIYVEFSNSNSVKYFKASTFKICEYLVPEKL